MLVQLPGTDAWKTLPPAMSLYCADGRPSGCPGDPTAPPSLLASPRCPCPCCPCPCPLGACLPRARSAIDLAGPTDANSVLIGWNSLASAALAIVRNDASLVMYCVRLPGSGWLLSHCGFPPWP